MTRTFAHHKIEVGLIGGVEGRVDGGQPWNGDGTRWQSPVLVSVVRGIDLQVPLQETTLERPLESQRVQDRRVTLELPVFSQPALRLMKTP